MKMLGKSNHLTKDKRKTTIDGWMKEIEPSRRLGIRKLAERVYDNVNEMPTYADVLSSKMPFAEKCTLVEKLDILDNTDKGSPPYFGLKKEILKTIESYKKMKEGNKELERINSKEKNLHPSMRNPLRFKILKANITNENKAIIMEKHNRMINLPPWDSDRGKIAEWISWALCIIEDQVRIPISLSNGNLAINKYLWNVKDYMSKHLYGMDSVKDSFLELLASRISNPNSKELSIGLLGSPGVGKCLHPDTLLLKYSGGWYRAKDVQSGDLLMGDDSKPRKVLSVNDGTDLMFKLTLSNGESFTVNQPHVLTLYDTTLKKELDMPLDKYMTLDRKKKRKLFMFSKSVIYKRQETDNKPFMIGLAAIRHEKIRKLLEPPDDESKTFDVYVDFDFDEIKKVYETGVIPDKYMFNSANVRLRLIRGLLELIKMDTVNYVIKCRNDTMKDQVLFIMKSLGQSYKIDGYNIYPSNPHLDFVHWKRKLLSFTVKYMGKGKYNGFTLDGNGRFMLKSCVITHNTHLVKVFSEAVKLPYYKINMGGSADVSHFLGHNFTYVGSQPGVMVKAIKNMKSKSGIIYLDEFDKLGQSKWQGSSKVSQAFLHISDPVQQEEFTDQYLSEIKIDLSNIIFVYSFNDEKNIDPILRNRIPILKVPGYSTKDKLEICKKYLIPALLKNTGLKKKDITFTEDALRYIITNTKDKDCDGIRTVKYYLHNVIKKINLLKITSHPKGNLNLSYRDDSVRFPYVVDINTFKKFDLEVKKYSSAMLSMYC